MTTLSRRAFLRGTVAQTNSTVAPKIEGRISFQYRSYLPTVSQPIAVSTTAGVAVVSGD
jgi:hypothetical protein